MFALVDMIAAVLQVIENGQHNRRNLNMQEDFMGQAAVAFSLFTDVQMVFSFQFMVELMPRF